MTISEKPKSNIAVPQAERRRPAIPAAGNDASGRRQPLAGEPGREFRGSALFAGLDIDGLRRCLLRFGNSLVGAFLDAFLEAAHRSAQVGPDIAQLLGPEDQQDDHQHDQPVPDAETSHYVLLSDAVHARTERCGPAQHMYVKMIHLL